MAEADKVAIGEQILIRETDALLVIDLVQGTFRPGGDLPVAGGDEIIPVVTDVAMPKFLPEQTDATIDVHPRGHNCRVDSYRRRGKDDSRPPPSFASAYVGIEPFTVLTLETIADWTDDCLAPDALFTLTELREYLGAVRSQVVWPVHGDPLSRKTWFCAPFRREQFNLVLMKGTDPNDDSYSAVRSNRGRSSGLIAVYRRRGVKRVFLVGLAFDYCVRWSAEDLAAAGFEVVVIEDATRAVFPDKVGEVHASFAEKGIRMMRSECLIAENASLRPPLRRAGGPLLPEVDQ